MRQQNATAERAKRIDPLKTIVDKDLLRMASDMYLLKQNAAYWKDVPVPTRPLGKVCGETAFQIGVFALPMLAYFGAALRFGFVHSLYGLPLYYALFVKLDEALLNAILKKRAAEDDRDRGRYAFTRILGERLGLKPEEVTLDVMMKMTCDFGLLCVYGLTLAQEKKDGFMRYVYAIPDLDARLNCIITYYTQNKHLTRTPKAPEKSATYRGTADQSDSESSRATSPSALSAADDDSDDPFYPSVNAMTGLPMIHGTPFDIGGNVFGQGTVGGFD